ncbi:MAG TPA: glycosyltransferase family 2 protein [Patescibacteria group bacterium]|nr:glycosyltransferase family 2 protein [Patescibacteria group bacterium]
MTLSLQLLVFNGSNYLPGLFETLENQTDKDWHLYVVENGSKLEEKEKALVFLETYKREHPSFPFFFEDFPKNLGFSGGHQHLFTVHETDAVLLLNQDTLLNQNFVADLRSYLESDPTIGAVTGKILRWDWGTDGRPERSSIIDSLGLAWATSGKVWDIASGESDRSEETEPREVFGISGCLPLYRRAAVLASSPDGLLFDPSFHSYKEDVDLAYRLRRSGWRAVVLPTVIAYHQRSFQKKIPVHRQASFWLEYLSYRNHWWTLIIHWSGKDFFRNAWAWLPFETAKFGYFLMKRPGVLWKTFQETRHQWGHLMERRRVLKNVSYVKQG